MTQQPKWRFVANFGDANPLDYGGLFLYEDTTGVYGFEAERIEPEEDEGNKIEVRRVCLDRLKEVRQGDHMYLVPFAYEESWTHPLLAHASGRHVAAYVEWFAKDLDSIASTMSTTVEELRRGFCSENGAERLESYRAVYDYHGWDNGDSYPLTLTRSEAKKRYRKELKELKRAP